jgi:hypothetical protein
MEKQRPGRLPGVLIVLISVLVLVMVVYTHHERTGENLSRVSVAREPSPAVAEAEARAQRAREAKQEAEGAKQEAEGERQEKAREAAVANEAKTMEASERKKAGIQEAGRPPAATEAGIQNTTRPSGATRLGVHEAPSAAMEASNPKGVGHSAQSSHAAAFAAPARGQQITFPEAEGAMRRFADQGSQVRLVKCVRVENRRNGPSWWVGGIACVREDHTREAYEPSEGLFGRDEICVSILEATLYSRDYPRPEVHVVKRPECVPLNGGAAADEGPMFSLEPGSIKLSTTYDVQRALKETDALSATKSVSEADALSATE